MSLIPIILKGLFVVRKKAPINLNGYLSKDLANVNVLT